LSSRVRAASDPIRPATLQRVLERLGFAAPPPPTLEGLNDLYRAWCRAVPFDNVRKRISLASGDEGPLPGGRAEDFLESWLRHGTGGTCWPSSNGLFALLDACGFDARRVSGSMQDTGEPNHGSVLVRIDGVDHLADSSMLTDAVFALRRGEPLRIDDPLHPISVEPAGATWVITWAFPFGDGVLPCRLLDDPVDHAFYLERYELSRRISPFNEHLYARRNFAGELLSYLGSSRFRKRASGVHRDDLERDSLAASLVSDLGLSTEIVAGLRASGALLRA
jgi:N-hydroxyarylamine O-acetyltransferase